MAGPGEDFPYEFYQYWRYIEDVKVEECARPSGPPSDGRSKKTGCNWKVAEINKAKEVLAYEITKIVHGEEEAESTDCCKSTVCTGRQDRRYPDYLYPAAELEEGKDILTLLVDTKLQKNRSEARRLVNTGRCFCQ